ncbi:hypothetical protein SCHPADRAFT_567950 [Schizopora paradoxa]|uniref:Uncharacterized protein n=1 Tax=Schizopora paradoxa TaxID=27342 RepID=A0A0H2RX98_9AGAM|nr:hypothetical protein SCHPADRAFT_567950 [Schizopora paradoxa]
MLLYDHRRALNAGFVNTSRTRGSSSWGELGCGRLPTMTKRGRSSNNSSLVSSSRTSRCVQGDVERVNVSLQSFAPLNETSTLRVNVHRATARIMRFWVDSIDPMKTILSTDSTTATISTTTLFASGRGRRRRKFFSRFRFANCEISLINQCGCLTPSSDGPPSPLPNNHHGLFPPHVLRGRNVFFISFRPGVLRERLQDVK